MLILEFFKNCIKFIYNLWIYFVEIIKLKFTLKLNYLFINNLFNLKMILIYNHVKKLAVIVKNNIFFFLINTTKK